MRQEVLVCGNRVEVQVFAQLRYDVIDREVKATAQSTELVVEECALFYPDQVLRLFQENRV